MYHIYDYGDMMADVGRIEAFAAALRTRVTSESVVLEIGAGAGTLTMLACQAGARRVYAVEPDGIIQLAREMAAANGYADRVNFIQARSTDIELPERVDVIVSDIAGVLPAFQGSLPAILDARDRFLKPHGQLIPERDSLFVGIVPRRAAPASILECWDDRFGLDCRPARRRVKHTWRKWRAGPRSLQTAATSWAVLDYHHVQTPHVSGRAAWTIEAREAGEACGLCVWFDSQTAPGCGFSNSPLASEEHCYQQALFPWPGDVRLECGDHVTVDLRADVVGEGYIWSWNTRIDAGGANSRTCHFTQSEFLGTPIANEWRRKSGSTFVPSPNAESEIDRMILDVLFTGATLEAIARQVSDRFPRRFPTWQEALTRVGELSLRYSE